MQIKTKLAVAAPGNESDDGLKSYYNRIWYRIQARQK
jgi:hypothetical protein